MRILVPIAGRSTFFKPEDYPFPKPLIEVAGLPMIERVVQNLGQLLPEARFVFVAQRDDLTRHSLESTLRLITNGNCDIISVDAPTGGAACSCLLAIEALEDEDELLIANGDQIIQGNLRNIIAGFRRERADAGVVTFPSVHPRWSYVRLDSSGLVVQAEEKVVLSHDAIAGLYWFRRCADFIASAQQMIRDRQEVNGQYFIAPSLNYLVIDGKRVVRHAIRAEAYHSFYAPHKITEYEQLFRQGNMSEEYHVKDHPKSINLVIPMAGQGSRFVEAGYKKPKPFIDVEGKPMIERVIDNVSVQNANIILLARRDHLTNEAKVLDQMSGNRRPQIVPVEKLTEGTACTVLLARSHIDNDTPLLIANSDQLVDFSCDDFVADCFDRDLYGSILCFRDPTKDPKWSFARLDANNLVVEVAEKKPISDLATVGIYLFRKGSEFVASALDMIVRNDRVNNEFYTCPVYNYMIAAGAKIGIYTVEQSGMHGLGTPADLDKYLARKRA